MPVFNAATSPRCAGQRTNVQAQARVREAGDDIHGPVRRTAIDDYQLEICKRLIQHALNSFADIISRL